MASFRVFFLAVLACVMMSSFAAALPASRARETGEVTLATGEHVSEKVCAQLNSCALLFSYADTASSGNSISARDVSGDADLASYEPCGSGELAELPEENIFPGQISESSDGTTSRRAATRTRRSYCENLFTKHLPETVMSGRWGCFTC